MYMQGYHLLATSPSDAIWSLDVTRRCIYILGSSGFARALSFSLRLGVSIGTVVAVAAYS
jgi:hypothetical protein